MAKSNQELTTELEQLKVIVGQNADLLNKFMPELRVDLKRLDDKQVADAARTALIDDKLEEHLTPLVSADLISKQTKTDSKAEELFKMFTELKSTVAQHKVEPDKVTSQTTSHDDTMAPMKATFAGIEAAMKQANADVKEVQEEVKREHQIGETRHAATQGQLAVISQQGNGSSSSGSRTSEPFVTHKLIMGKEKISGDEDFTLIDAWIKELEIDLEIIMPGAKQMMVDAQICKTVIDTSALLSSPNAAAATRLSRELYVIFTKKTMINTKARFELQNLTENQGLEALRLIRLNLCKREGQRLQDEYEVGTTLPKIKESDMGNLVSLLRRWESEINKFEAIDKGYSLGIFQRRNLVYRALPEAVQKDVDKEVAKGELVSYESFMDFIRNLSRSARYQKQAAPKPLTANIIENNPGPMSSTWQAESPSNNIYSVDEWSEWLQGDEGQQAIQDGVELPSSPEMHLALLAVAKGKGKWTTKGGNDRWPKGGSKGDHKGKGGHKGGGKGKGSNSKGAGGKRPFTGNCHECGQPGHMARDCPSKGLKYVEGGNHSFFGSRTTPIVASLYASRNNFSRAIVRICQICLHPQDKIRIHKLCQSFMRLH